MSLRLRINLVVTAMIAAFAILAAHIVLKDMRSSIREETEAATRIAAQLLRTAVAGTAGEPGAARRGEALLAFLRRAGRVHANELRLYDEAGRLLYRSPPPAYRAAEQAPEWFARLVQPAAEPARLSIAGGAIVVLPDSSRSVLEAWDDAQRLAALALAFLLAMNAVVFWFVQRSLRPLAKVREALAEMARGRFEARLPEALPEELASISRGFNRMAQALGESLAQNRRLALVAQQSSDAIVIRDLEGRVSFCNAAAERLLGFEASELAGADARLTAPAERHGELRDTLETIKRGERVELLETERLTKSGRRVDVALSAAPFVDPASGRVVGEICSMRDIGEARRRQAAERALEENRRLAALLQSQIEEERRSLARELHDELAQCLTAIRSIATAIAARAGGSAPDIRDHAKTIASIAARVYDAAHAIVRRLRPGAPGPAGLAERLQDALSECARAHPALRCELEISGSLEGLGEAAEIAVYRIVQEALTNVVRHAEATRARVRVSRCGAPPHADALVVRIEDDGKGLAQGLGRARLGLRGMRERVQALGGSVEISGAPGRGVTVRAVVPLAAGAEATAPVEA